MSQPAPQLAKVLSQEAAEALIYRWHFFGKKVVFTNGVFDILHRGHADYLLAAHNLGDKLVVGLNSDASVKRLNKGPERPINSEEDRAVLLANLQVVDAVVIFEEDTPLELVKAFKPDVLVKGGDYNPAENNSSNPGYIVGSSEVRSWKGEVVSIPLTPGKSTTGIVNKMRTNG